MDEHLIDIAKAICCASPCEGCKGHGEGGCFEFDLWSREARAAHSVMAGKVAELTRLLLQARHHIVFAVDVDPNAADLANAIDAALAPHPKGME